MLTSTGNNLVASSAVPDANGSALDVDLSAEGAGVLGVLGDFHLLDLLTEGSTVSVRGGFGLACYRAPGRELLSACDRTQGPSSRRFDRHPPTKPKTRLSESSKRG